MLGITVTRHYVCFFGFSISREIFESFCEKILLICQVVGIGYFFILAGSLLSQSNPRLSLSFLAFAVLLCVYLIRSRLHRFLIINYHFLGTQSMRSVSCKIIYLYSAIFISFTIVGILMGTNFDPGQLRAALIAFAAH